MPKGTKEVSAQVILKPSQGSFTDTVTSENVARMMPTAEDMEKAKSYFSERGFKVEHAFGNSFSITGPESLFEKAFKSKLSKGEKGEVKAARRGGSQSFELSTDDLPKGIADIVETVTFSEPPDFGPGNF